MKTITMLDFRRRAEAILEQVQKGQRFLVTYRGKEVARLEPIVASEGLPDDPFYTLDRLAGVKGKSLSNAAIDRIVYGA